MATWRSMSSKLRVMVVLGAILAVVLAGVLVVPVLMSCESTVEAEPRAPEDRREASRQREREAAEEFHQRWAEEEAEQETRWKQLRQESEDREEAIRNQTEPPKRRVRHVRRFTWESPAETRGKLWNVPVEETVESLLTALLRVCIAEANGDPQDCAGIWQVVKNNRRRSCDRGMIRRITECVEGEGETYLSALRRHQRHVLGMMKARNRRAVWISQLTLDCEMPEGFPGTQDQWHASYGSTTCPQTVADVRRLVAGKLPESRPGARTRWLPGRPITWGGRCETGRAACDDRVACARGLARVPDTGTLNAFWCRPGDPGCPDDIDPICIQMGYQSLRAVTVVEPEEPSSDENS